MPQKLEFEHVSSFSDAKAILFTGKPSKEHDGRAPSLLEQTLQLVGPQNKRKRGFQKRETDQAPAST
jgi:hypothetical protein